MSAAPTTEDLLAAAAAAGRQQLPANPALCAGLAPSVDCGVLGGPTSMALALLREQDRLLTARAAAAQLIRREEELSAMRIAAAVQSATARMTQAQAASARNFALANQVQIEALSRQHEALHVSRQQHRGGLGAQHALALHQVSTSDSSGRSLINAALALADRPINDDNSGGMPPLALPPSALPFAPTKSNSRQLFERLSSATVKVASPRAAAATASSNEASKLVAATKAASSSNETCKAKQPAKKDVVTKKAKKPRKAPKKGKDRKPHKRKPLDMPRRALSAYNLFFAEERRRILAEQTGETITNEETTLKSDEMDMSRTKARSRPHRKSHGSIGFKDLTKTIAARWKALPTERVEHFQRLSRGDSERQKRAMEEYHAKQKLRDAENARTLLQMAAGSSLAAGASPAETEAGSVAAV